MHIRWRELLPIGAVLLLAIGMFLPGIGWGQPSHAVDPYLFGDRPVWSGAKIYALSGGWDADAAMGADVARHPLEKSPTPVLLNGTDEQRARIIQRYRLYSEQPDEMITFRALSGIDARHLKLDPKLYQYGGIWIYGVGAMLAVAKAIGVITVRHDVAYYLDHPEAFGRFYVVARLYAAAWGLVLVVAVYGLLRQMGSTRKWAAIGAAVVATMPVVVNAAHEAKPHLPGAALVMLAVLAAGEYARRGGWRWLVGTGALCGAAMGMVLWAAPCFVLVVSGWGWRRWVGDPAAARRTSASSVESRDAVAGLGSILVGGVVYAFFNPYVLMHLLVDPGVLRSNLHNTSAMYSAAAGSGALVNALWLIVVGMSPFAGPMGIAGTIVLATRAWRRRSIAQTISPTRLLLAAAAIVMAIPYIALAAGKPGEYGRFALVPDIALAIAAAKCIEDFAGRATYMFIGVVLGGTSIFGAIYTNGFVQNNSRSEAAASIAQMPGDQLAIIAEPAPYSLPPVDLFRWKLLLMPNWDAALIWPDVVACRMIDTPPDGQLGFTTQLSWANKPIEMKSR